MILIEDASLKVIAVAAIPRRLLQETLRTTFAGMRIPVVTNR